METFKENGSYNKTIWEIGDIITSEKLNKIEDALYEMNEADKLNLSNYATKDELPKKVSDLYNDVKYTTREYIEDNYAQKSDLPYKMSQLTNNVGYVTINHEHDEYATKEELSDVAIPTNISGISFLVM